MIVTVTLNAALDRTLHVPNFQAGLRHRAESGLNLPGGKGVNVARALKRLGEPVIATGLAGGPVGSWIVEELTAEGILNDFVLISEGSRTSTAVIDATTGQRTEINEYGPAVEEAELAVLLDKVRYLSKGAELFVLAGSLPRNVPSEFYAAIISELKAKKIVTALDTAGPPLEQGIAACPAVVSPNVREAEDLVGHEFHDLDDLVGAARTLGQMGAGTALIHDRGGCVAFVRGGRGRGNGRLLRATVAQREVVSAVGSGDALLAGYLSARYHGEPPEAALALGVACGAANTQRLGAGVFDLEDVEALRRQVSVEPLDGPDD